jgi:hypothetical protein
MKTILHIIQIVNIVKIFYCVKIKENLRQMESPAMYVMPRITKAPEPSHLMQNIPEPITTTIIPSCPCAAKIQCQPCGAIIPILEQPCPCAPKPHCPACPPLSLIHDIASKKVRAY